jgi:hypothetical protein
MIHIRTIYRHTKINQRLGDIEIKDYVVLQNPQPQDNRLPPPRTLIMDFTMTHVRFGSSPFNPIGQLTHTRRSDGAPDPDGVLKEVDRIKIRHYRNIESTRPNSIFAVRKTDVSR